MSEKKRDFEPISARIGGKNMTVRRIRCATPGCGFEGDIIDGTRNGLPSEVTERKFRQKGWEVGASEKHDYCPSCVEKIRLERRARRKKPQGEVMSDTVDTAPREMTREDRRIIFAKLSDVYLDEASGYQPPWTDKKVADDLGVPRAWVEQIRDENFGPASDNSAIREMLERVETSAKEAQSLLADAKKVRSDVADLVQRANLLSQKATDVGKDLSGLLILADRIKESVS